MISSFNCFYESYATCVHMDYLTVVQSFLEVVLFVYLGWVFKLFSLSV